MDPKNQIEPSDLTKVLIKKIHSGRNLDSKFWQSEFSNQSTGIDIDIHHVKQQRKGKSKNPVWEVVWRFLIFCLILDGGIFFYFHVVKNMTVLEGIESIRAAIHNKEQTVKQPVAIQPQEQPPTSTHQKTASAPALPSPTKYLVELTNGQSMLIEHYSINKNEIELFVKDGFSIQMQKSQIKSIKKI